jgi:hypothetical protein
LPKNLNERLGFNAELIAFVKFIGSHRKLHGRPPIGCCSNGALEFSFELLETTSRTANISQKTFIEGR